MHGRPTIIQYLVSVRQVSHVCFENKLADNLHAPRALYCRAEQAPSNNSTTDSRSNQTTILESTVLESKVDVIQQVMDKSDGHLCSCDSYAPEALRSLLLGGLH